MYKILERIILDRLIKHREETTRDEQVGFPPGRSTIDQMFIISKAAFDSPHRGRLLKALRADGVPGKFVRLLDDMNQRTTAAVRTPAGCTIPFEVVTGVRQGAVAGPFLFNFAIDDIMRRTVDQCPADIVLAPSGCPLADLEYTDDVVIFAESSTKLQHVVNLLSKLAAAYGLRLRPDKCKQMWISLRPRTGIRVDGQLIELVDEFCYLGYEMPLVGPRPTNEVKLRVYLSAIRPIMMYRSETWAEPTTVIGRLDCTERMLLRRLLDYFWLRVCHNEDLYAEIDVVYRRTTCGRYQHFAPPSKVAEVNRLRFFGHILRRPADRLVQRVLRSLPGSSWKKPPGRKRKFWTEVVKKDLRTLGVNRQFRRDIRFRRIWNSDEWIDSVQALAEDREGWAELCSRTAHLGEDAVLLKCTMSEVAERYVEQIQTTAETLRRRVVAYYDGIFFLANKMMMAADRARDVAEPVAYDVKDYVTSASNQSEPVSGMEKDMKNNIVLMLGISSGELAGAFVFPGLLEKIFDPFLEFAVLLLVPTYVLLNIRKNAAMDDTERRTCLFGFCLVIGILLGHLVGGALTSIAPSVFFIPPLLLSLLMDNELIRSPLADMERNSFFAISGAASSLLCTIFAMLPVGYFSMAIFLLSLLHVAFLTIHFQVVTQCAKEKIMMVGESQFSYIMGVLFLQLVMAALFGSDPNVIHQTPPPPATQPHRK
ncbi:hypothetical protein RB195_005708 [Necator americanus]|uniref:Reverse transcriptase domain-containing protein n=1 Tax=Necator americanus TaxID=51031 RepID=A0ABR1BS48_NECAM